MFDLTGKVALVAGGAGYLGTPVCEKLAGQGASVVISDINTERAAMAAEDISRRVPGSKVMTAHMNIAEEKSIKAAVAEAAEKFGRLDIMVNATAAAAGKLVEELGVEEFDKALHANLVGSRRSVRCGYKRVNERIKFGDDNIFHKHVKTCFGCAGITGKPVKPRRDVVTGIMRIIYLLICNTSHFKSPHFKILFSICASSVIV